MSIDANILFAALIKEGLTSELLFLPDLKLYAPDFLMAELLEYESLILAKSSRSKEQLVGTLHILMDIITTIPKEEFSNFLQKAKDVSPDPDDFVYFALALKLQCAIWSNDKKLKEQDAVAVYNTAEVMRKVHGKRTL